MNQKRPAFLDEIDNLENRIQTLKKELTEQRKRAERETAQQQERIEELLQQNIALVQQRQTFQTNADAIAERRAQINIFQFLKQTAEAFRFLEYYRNLPDGPSDLAVYDETLDIIKRKLNSHLIEIHNQTTLRTKYKGFMTKQNQTLIAPVYEGRSE